jgi:dTDP-4-dehydrorhamnose reductase
VRVAITGANGLVGGAAVALLAGTHELLAIGRGDSRLAPGDYLWGAADLARRGDVAAALRAFRPQAVLHCAALTDVDACERQRELAFAINAAGTEEVARTCRLLGARLVALSTDYVFDGESGPYGEEDEPNPRGAYAASKREGEQAALSEAPDCAVARVAVVYSGRPAAKSTFASSIVERLRRGEPVSAFVDQLVSPTLARNAAEMTSELLLSHTYRGVLHTAGATVIDRVEFARRIALRFGLDPAGIRPIRLADAGLLAPRPRRAGLLVSRAAALLSAKPLLIDPAVDSFYQQWQERGAR